MRSTPRRLSFIIGKTKRNLSASLTLGAQSALQDLSSQRHVNDSTGISSLG
jgi:hypothetical protein